MTVIVTGGTGFLGRQVVRRIADREDVVALTRDPAAVPEEMRHPAVRFLPCNFSVGIDTGRLPKAVSAVVHLAQSPRYREFPAGARDVFAVNVAATMELAAYAQEAGAEQFLYASSGSICIGAEDGSAEHTAVFPRDLYSASKLAAETLLRPYEALMKVSCLRLFGLYGPDLSEKLVHQLWTRINSGAPITLQGTGEGLALPLTHVEDCADCILTALSEGWQGVYNIAPSEIVSIRRIAEILGEQAGRSPVFEVVAGETPAAIRPDVSKLGAVYDLSRLRLPEIGLRDSYPASGGGSAES